MQALSFADEVDLVGLRFGDLVESLKTLKEKAAILELVINEAKTKYI